LLLAEAATPHRLTEMVEQRVAGTPLEYVLGWAEFCGLRIAVDDGVFVPRRRTEFLARQAIASVRPGATVLDLCCGSGAVAAAILACVGGVDLYAVDIDPVAVACARRNVGATVYEGDLYQPVPQTLRGRVDVIVANAPYVPTDEVALMPSEARLFEHRVALDGGVDGLQILRRVVRDAPGWLAPGGTVLCETSERQAPELAGAVAAAGLEPDVRHWDEAGATVVIGGMRA
jgi:release factor glutamine methyltransferase